MVNNQYSNNYASLNQNQMAPPQQKSKIDFTPINSNENEEAQKNVNRGMQIVKEQGIELPPGPQQSEKKSNIEFTPVGIDKVEGKEPFQKFKDSSSNVEEDMDPFESAFRYVAQGGKGAAYAYAGIPGLMLELNKMSAFDIDPEEMDILKKRFPNRDIEEELNESGRQALKYSPSISSIFQIAEEDLGIPTEAKTEGQKAFEIFSLTLSPEGKMFLYKPGMAKAVGATLAYETMKSKGVPEGLASFLAISGPHAVHSFLKPPEIKYSPIRNEIEAPFIQEPSHPGAITAEESRAKYDIGEDTLSLLKKTKAIEKTEASKQGLRPSPSRISPTKAEKQKLLESQIIPEEGSQIVKRVAEKKIEEGVRSKQEIMPEPLTPTERVGEKISKFTNPNKQEIGKEIRDVTFDRSQAKYKKVNEAYKESRELNSGIELETSRLHKNMEALVNEAKVLPEYKEDAQLVKMAEDIKDRLVEHHTTTEDGKLVPISFKKMSSQELIDLATDLRKYVDSAYAHTSKNVFYKIIDVVEDTILDAAKENPAAYKSYLKAKQEYSSWQKTYNNDFVRQLRDPDATDYMNIYKKSTNPDNYPIIASILEYNEGSPSPGLVSHIVKQNTEKGTNLSKVLKRDIVESQLEPWLIKGEKFNKGIGHSRHFKDKLQSMSNFLPISEQQSIINETKNLDKSFGGRSVKINKPIEASDYFWEGKIPEDIADELNTVSGLKKNDARLKDFPDQYKQFEQLKHELAIRRLTSGEYVGDERSIMSVLNKPDNIRYLEEAVGKDMVKNWREKAVNIEKYKAETEKYNQEMKALEKKELRDRTESEKMKTQKAKEELEKRMETNKRNRNIAHIVLSPLPAPSLLKHFIIESFLP